jgi:hypothetical protein
MDETDQPSSGSFESLIRLLVKSNYYAVNDPEACLNFARKSAEAICRYIYSAHVGHPGKTKFEGLISQLSKQGHLPGRLVQPLVTVQKYGNFGSHSQDDCDEINSEYITPGGGIWQIVYGKPNKNLKAIVIGLLFVFTAFQGLAQFLR